MASKARGSGRDSSDCKSLMSKLTQYESAGKLSELFEDDYFITDIVKVLYEDGLDSQDKMEILGLIEQEASKMLDKNSVDQVITALTNMFADISHNSGTIVIASQLLITITTLFIDHDEYMESELCTKFISVLMDLLMKVNNIGNRRLRAIACQCLGQLEAWKSGMLWKWKDTLNKLAREERTDICQDYLQLLVTVTNSSLEEGSSKPDGGDMLPVVSYAMDNVASLTTSGFLAIMYPTIRLVQNSAHISPTVFKPVMLQYLPSNDLNIMYLLLHIQKQFRGEILSASEEKDLLCRQSDYVNHATFPCNGRLLATQWLTSFVKQHQSEEIKSVLMPASVPKVFHSLDIHTCLLALHLLTKIPNNSQNISRDLYYLTQLAETTGGIRVTCCLYYLMYLQVRYHSSEGVHDNSLRITKTLFESFPHLIPLIVNFLQAVKTSCPETMFHGEILNLLHKTVLSLPLSSLLSNYQNYLQVWVLSAEDPNMYQQKQLRRLLELVQEASSQAADDWALGSLILSICRTMMIHHHSDTFYPQMGDLLFFMMHYYGELDIQDHARFYYALLTLSSDEKTKEILKSDLVEGIQLGENIANIFPGSAMQALPSEIKDIDHSPIIFKRSKLSVLYETAAGNEDDIDKHSEDFMKRYRQQLSNINTYFECHFAATIMKESDYTDLIAVSFFIKDAKKQPICEDVHIPFMLKDVATDVMFKFCPDPPVPCSLYPSAIFSHERTTFQCNVAPIQLKLRDFLVPFPWHLFQVPTRWQLFETLWQECTVGTSGTCHGVESVKIMKCKQKQLHQVWKEASVMEDMDVSFSNRATDCYLFFLPPSFHLLFQADARTNDTVLRIASDFPPIFGFLDDYLETF